MANSYSMPALPYALITTSQSLTALHTSRARKLASESDSLDTTHCTTCGSYLFNGQGSVRLVTVAKRSRVLRRSCERCGSVNDAPVSKGNASLFPRTRKHMPAHGLTPPAEIRPPSPSPDPSTFRSRPKKKSALQDMLDRNREKQAREREQANQSGGLAAFLSAL